MDMKKQTICLISSLYNMVSASLTMSFFKLLFPGKSVFYFAATGPLAVFQYLVFFLSIVLRFNEHNTTSAYRVLKSQDYSSV